MLPEKSDVKQLSGTKPSEFGGIPVGPYLFHHSLNLQPPAVFNAKKQRKTKEWERLEISLRKLKISREHFMQRWAQ